ncbi:hypothetical protein AX769_01475 [Frondihabitans sp. PAMC 28766]|uniref:SDR family NAD(P)-dependent oxidoreductase n=1 Tax=Frondihabitans sp. PAMC 28766 TaxID=1795630 RepID=UPI00078EC3EE|nr:SDR family NAD(P)-dependent oxidoreductase [Frondihabitans sp. PAMC 28766]AMM19050.1 hypothetical protein AX769_01475 [Frondihabitans sp. PAMC 28766]
MSETAESNRPHAVVIGAGPGIGASVARRLASEGFDLTLVSRDTARLGELAVSLRASGGGDGGSDGPTVDVQAGDASDPAALREALEAVRDRATPPSILVYNAAMLEPTSLLTVSEAKLAEGYAVDVIGAIVAAQVFLPAMQEAAQGTVIFTSGGAGIHPSPGIATVSMGKAALRSAATMLAAEVSEGGVHVVSVAVSGAVEPGTLFDPDLIADLYWRLHTQPQAEWTSEEPFDGVAA